MNKSNVIYTSLGIALGAALMIGASSFATVTVTETNDGTEVQVQTKGQFAQRGGQRGGFPMMNFLSPDLTDEDKEELKTALQAHAEEGKELHEALVEAKEAGEDTTDLEAELEEHRASMFDIMDEYIDPEKADEWEEFKITAAENLGKSPRQGRMGNERGEMGRKGGFPMMNFLDPDLTDEQKEELKTALQAHAEEGKELHEALVEAKEAGEDTTDLEAELEEHRASMFDIMDEYIDPEKADEWEEFKTNMEERMGEGRMGGMKRGCMGGGQRQMGGGQRQMQGGKRGFGGSRGTSQDDFDGELHGIENVLDI